MEHLVRFRGSLLAGLIYAVVTLGWAGVHAAAEAIPLVWLPSGIAVASLYMMSQRSWPALLLALTVGQFASWLLIGESLLISAGFSFIRTMEAAVCVLISIRLMDGSHRRPDNIRHIGGLFGAAVASVLASGLIALPFISELSAPELGAWFLADVLGILTFTPIVLWLVSEIHELRQGDRRLFWAKKSLLAPLAMAAMFGLALFVLKMTAASLLFLLVMALTIAVLRFGQNAAYLGIFAYLIAATALSIGDGSPISYFTGSSVEATLLLQVALGLMLATSLPLAILLENKTCLDELLRSQNTELASSLTMLTIAEKLAGVGRLRLDLRSGRQEWSPLMLQMNGLSAHLEGKYEGIREMLPDGGETLFKKLNENCSDKDPYSFDYTVKHPDESARILRVIARNEFDENGEARALFAVAKDITEQVARERALELAREEALTRALEAQTLALTDPLTGIANRRATFEQLEALTQESLAAGWPLSIVLFDIDHFKRINDQYGHQAGDETLQRVAELARMIVRVDDPIGRVGGEEFVWLLPRLELTRARELAERLRAAIEENTARGNVPGVTISIGIAQMRPSDTPQSLMARADKALYAAKEGGRNRVKRAA